MARAARWIYRVCQLISGVLALLQLSRAPEEWHHEPGVQPPTVAHPDDLHGDLVATVQDDRARVEQAPTPELPSPAGWDWNQAAAAASFRRAARYWRPYYATLPDDTAVIWHAAEQAKKTAA